MVRNCEVLCVFNRIARREMKPVTRKRFSGSVANDTAQSPTVWMTEKAPKNPAAGWCVHTCTKPESSATNNVPMSGPTFRAAKKINARTATARTMFNADSWWAHKINGLLLHKISIQNILRNVSSWFQKSKLVYFIRRSIELSSLRDFSYFCIFVFPVTVYLLDRLASNYAILLFFLYRDNIKLTSPPINIDHSVLSKRLSCFKLPEDQLSVVCSGSKYARKFHGWAQDVVGMTGRPILFAHIGDFQFRNASIPAAA